MPTDCSVSFRAYASHFQAEHCRRLLRSSRRAFRHDADGDFAALCLDTPQASLSYMIVTLACIDADTLFGFAAYRPASRSRPAAHANSAAFQAARQAFMRRPACRRRHFFSPAVMPPFTTMYFDFDTLETRAFSIFRLTAEQLYSDCFVSPNIEFPRQPTISHYGRLLVAATSHLQFYRDAMTLELMIHFSFGVRQCWAFTTAA